MLKGSGIPSDPPKHRRTAYNRKREAEHRKGLRKVVFVINIVLWGLCLLSLANSLLQGKPHPAGLVILLFPIGVTVFSVLVLLMDSVRDYMSEAKIADEKDRMRMHVEDEARQRELRRSGNDPERLARHLQRGGKYRITHDGEIVLVHEDDKHTTKGQ